MPLRWPASGHSVKLQRLAAPAEARFERRWLQE